MDRESEYCTVLDGLIKVEESLAPLGVFVAYTISWFTGGSRPSKYPFEEEIGRLLKYVKSKYTLETLREDPIVRAYRSFYWRIGIDPTKTRPSSEALVRRALRGRFPRINPVVDAGNIASAYTLVPIGMYDLDRVSQPLELRTSRGGEVFNPIGGGVEELEHGVPILVDSRSLVLHVYPHRDSRESMIRDSTTHVLVVGAGVPDVEEELVRRAVYKVIKLLGRIGWASCSEVVVTHPRS